MPDGELLNRQRAAERALLQMGITFNVYGERAGTEKICPFDLVPRIVPAAEWIRIERGLKQRVLMRRSKERKQSHKHQRPRATTARFD